MLSGPKKREICCKEDWLDGNGPRQQGNNANQRLFFFSRRYHFLQAKNCSVYICASLFLGRPSLCLFTIELIMFNGLLWRYYFLSTAKSQITPPRLPRPVVPTSASTLSTAVKLVRLSRDAPFPMQRVTWRTYCSSRKPSHSPSTLVESVATPSQRSTRLLATRSPGHWRPPEPSLTCWETLSPMLR